MGIPALLDLEPGSVLSIGFHVAATVLFLGVALWIGPPVYRALLRFRFNVVKRGSADRPSRSCSCSRSRCSR